LRSYPRIVTESGEAGKDTGANSGDVRCRQGAVGVTGGHAECHALPAFGHRRSLVFADVLDSFHEGAAEFGDIVLEVASQIACTRDDGKIEGAYRKAVDWRVACARGRQLQEEIQIEIEKLRRGRFRSGWDEAR